MPNYVKFQRGSQAAYTALLNSANKGAAFYDTLYFIYDSENKAAGGTLYLGDILIGGAGQVGATTLAGLSDIDLTDLDAGSFLQYNNITFGKNLLFKKAESLYSSQKYSKCIDTLKKYINK